jgi:hypothetical protein
LSEANPQTFSALRCQVLFSIFSFITIPNSYTYFVAELKDPFTSGTHLLS